MCTEPCSAGAHGTTWLPQGSVIPPLPPNVTVLSTQCDQKDFFVASVAQYDGECLKNAEIQEVPAAHQSYAMQFFLHSMLVGIA